MAKSENTKTSIYRKRLVITLLLITFIQGICAGENFSLDNIKIRPAEEIMEQTEGFLFQQPWSYLPFLPGPLLLLILIILRKKKLLIFVSLILVISPLSSRAPAPEELRKGIAEYEAGFYQNALDYFLESENTLSFRSSLKFNIAACYYKLGKIGYAIDNLVKGIKQAPGDQEMVSFLKSLEEQNNLTAQVDILPLFHSDIPFIITIILFNLSFIVYSLTFRFKKGLLAIVFVFIVAFTITSFSLFLYNYKHTTKPSGVVIAGAAIIKKIPRHEAKDWIRLKDGTIVRVLGDTTDFVLIQTGRSLKGWIHKQDLLYK